MNQFVGVQGEGTVPDGANCWIWFKAVVAFGTAFAPGYWVFDGSANVVDRNILGHSMESNYLVMI